MLYIQSSRLAQLSALLPVNQDRPALVRSLIDAYGLLQVRASASGVCMIFFNPIAVFIMCNVGLLTVPQFAPP